MCRAAEPIGFSGAIQAVSGTQGGKGGGMNGDEVRYFIAVYESQSFSQAAAALSISSQGLGKSIKRLEGKLGVTLFTRSTQGAVPTAAAKALYPGMCALAADERRLLQQAAAFKEPEREQYLIGRDSNLGDVIQQGVADYNGRYGANIISVMTRDSEDVQAKTFVEKEYDYRFLSVELDVLPHLPHAKLTELHYTPVANATSSLARKGAITFDDLRGVTILVENLKYAHTQLLRKLCVERGFDPLFREVDKTYIWDLLRHPGNEVFFIKTSEATGYPWTSSSYAVLALDPPLRTEVVLQTSHDHLDKNLVACIRHRLEQAQFS